MYCGITIWPEPCCCCCDCCCGCCGCATAEVCCAPCIAAERVVDAWVKPADGPDLTMTCWYAGCITTGFPSAPSIGVPANITSFTEINKRLRISSVSIKTLLQVRPIIMIFGQVQITWLRLFKINKIQTRFSSVQFRVNFNSFFNNWTLYLLTRANVSRLRLQEHQWPICILQKTITSAGLTIPKRVPFPV